MSYGSPTTLSSMRGMKDVLRFLSDTPSPLRRVMGQIPSAAAQGLVNPATALAKAIVEFVPESLKANPLRVLVVTKPGVDTFDEGRWLQLASVLTGAPMAMSLILEDAPPFRDHTPVGNELGKVLPAATFLDVEPAQALAVGPAFDLIVLPTPSFIDDVDNPGRWAWIAEAVARGIPVVGWTYDALEREISLAFLKAMGFANAVTYDSVLTFEERPHPSLINHPGKFLFRLAAPESESLEVDENLQLMLIDLMRTGSGALQSGKATPWAGHVLNSPDGPLAVDFEGRGVHLESGEIYDVLIGRRGEPVFSKTARKVFRWTAIDPAELAQASMLDILTLADNACAEKLFEGMEELHFGEGAAELTADTLSMLGIEGEEATALAGMLHGQTGAQMGLPIFQAVERDDADSIHDLALRGHDPNERDAGGWAPLDHAAADGRVSAIEALLRVGAAMDTRHPLSGMTALDIAMQRGNSKAALVLLKAGANPDNEGFLTGKFTRKLLEGGHGNAELQAWYRTQTAGADGKRT